MPIDWFWGEEFVFFNDAALYAATYVLIHGPTFMHIQATLNELSRIYKRKERVHKGREGLRGKEYGSNQIVLYTFIRSSNKT